MQPIGNYLSAKPHSNLIMSTWYMEPLYTCGKSGEMNVLSFLMQSTVMWKCDFLLAAKFY